MWAGYVGVGWGCRDIAVDAEGDIYVPLIYSGSGGKPPSSWFANAYQADLKGGMENGLAKIKGDGSAVECATWIGGTGDEYGQATVRVDAGKNVYMNFMTTSSDMPVTPGAHDSTLAGTQDGFVAKFSPDGSKLLFGTCVGDPLQMRYVKYR